MFAVFEAATPTTPPVASVCTATTPATPLVASLCTATEIKRKRLDAMIRREATVGKRAVEHVLQAKRSVLGALHADALTAVEDAIGALHLWPRHTTYDMQRLGCTKQLNRTECFTLFLFMVGNGASPAVAVELLLATRSVRDRAAVRQLTEMVDKMANGTLAKFRKYLMASLSDRLAGDCAPCRLGRHAQLFARIYRSAPRSLRTRCECCRRYIRVCFIVGCVRTRRVCVGSCIVIVILFYIAILYCRRGRRENDI